MCCSVMDQALLNLFCVQRLHSLSLSTLCVCCSHKAKPTVIEFLLVTVTVNGQKNNTGKKLWKKVIIWGEKKRTGKKVTTLASKYFKSLEVHNLCMSVLLILGSSMCPHWVPRPYFCIVRVNFSRKSNTLPQCSPTILYYFNVPLVSLATC